MKKNQYDVCMITGDNVYTAINVGYNCGIIKEEQNLWIGFTENKVLKWNLQEYHQRDFKQ